MKIKRIVDYFRLKKLKYNPWLLRIEPTNICNADCLMCPRDKLTRPIGTMSFELFKRIIDEIKQFYSPKILHLQNFGEPLIDNGLAKKIRYAEHNGFYTIVFTNASLLIKEKAEELIKAGLSEILFSFFAKTEKTFNKIHKPLDFKVCKENILNFIEINKDYKKFGRKKPVKVTMSFKQMKENLDELEEHRKEWKSLVDEYTTYPIHNYGRALKVHKDIKPIEKCPLVYDTISIFWNGEWNLCCRDFDGECKIGDVNKQSIEEIWHSKRLEFIRKNPQKINPCDGCDFGQYNDLNYIEK